MKESNKVVERKAPYKKVESSSSRDKLPIVQEQVLEMVTSNFLTIEKIASVRGVTVQAIYKTIKKLKLKGYLTGTYIEGFKAWGVTNEGTRGEGEGFSNDKTIRLHGEQFKIPIIEILNKRKYQSLLGQEKIIFGRRVRFWKKCIEVYPNAKEEGKEGQNLGFFGKDEDEADAKSAEFHLRLFNHIQDYAKVKIIRVGVQLERVIAHYRVQAHYATTHDAIAQSYIKQKQVFKIIERNGICWMLADNSFGLVEREATHPKTSGPDSRIVNKHLNSWRDNPDCPTLPELAIAVKELCINSNNVVDSVSSNTQTLGIILSLIKSFLPNGEKHTSDEKDNSRPGSPPPYIG